jgi:uncharacterized protein with von Willebrand factor type A (vWA) domain
LIAIALRKQSEKVDYARTEMAGIETGNYLPDVLPEEFIKLEDPALENLFFREFLESKLQQYDLKSKEALAQGPIFVAIDCSGSMDSPIWIPKEIEELRDYREQRDAMSALPTAECWAKASALALFAIARRQRRDFEAVLFDDGIQAHIKIGRDEQFKPEQLALFFGTATYGGTDFQPPLEKFLESLQEQKNADCVFITDGLCDLDEPFLKRFKAERERLGFEVYSILVNAGLWGAASLKKFSTSVHCVPESAEEKVLDDIFSV